MGEEEAAARVAEAVLGDRPVAARAGVASAGGRKISTAEIVLAGSVLFLAIAAVVAVIVVKRQTKKNENPTA